MSSWTRSADFANELQGHDTSWPFTDEIDIPDLGHTLFCHATPRNDREIFTRVTAEERLASVFAMSLRRSSFAAIHTCSLIKWSDGCEW